MFERFTEKAIKSIMLAQEEARRLEHNFVGTEQILLGLLAEGSGIAFKSLRACGVNLKDARIEVEKIIGRGSGFVAVEIPFSPRAKRVLQLGWDEAARLGHGYMGTEHLLLGLLEDAEGVAARVLETLGVNKDMLRESVLITVQSGTQSQTRADRVGEAKSLFQTLYSSALARLTQQAPPPPPLRQAQPPTGEVEKTQRAPRPNSIEAWFSDDAIAAISEAENVAIQEGCPQLQGEHLFETLVLSCDWLPESLIEHVRVQAASREKAQVGSTEHSVEFSEEINQTFVDARRIASEWAADKISREHLLLALVKVDWQGSDDYRAPAPESLNKLSADTWSAFVSKSPKEPALDAAPSTGLYAQITVRATSRMMRTLKRAYAWAKERELARPTAADLILSLLEECKESEVAFLESRAEKIARAEKELQQLRLVEDYTAPDIERIAQLAVEHASRLVSHRLDLNHFALALVEQTDPAVTVFLTDVANPPDRRTRSVMKRALDLCTLRQNPISTHQNEPGELLKIRDFDEQFQ